VNKLTKTQKSQLLGVLLGTLALMAGLWYFAVTAKQEELSKTQKSTAQMLDTLKFAESKMRQSEEIADKMQARRDVLDKREALLAPDRDAYAWIISTLNPFVQSHKGVSILHYSQPDVTETGLIPNFPYKWATFRLEGNGFYHDLGKFFSDLENNFSSFRVQNLELSGTSASGIDAEKLNVSFELVVPVKATDTK
jgi:Tfp pilus assembly protein PilO